MNGKSYYLKPVFVDLAGAWNHQSTDPHRVMIGLLDMEERMVARMVVEWQPDGTADFTIGNTPLKYLAVLQTLLSRLPVTPLDVDEYDLIHALIEAGFEDMTPCHPSDTRTRLTKKLQKAEQERQQILDALTQMDAS